MSRIKGNNVQFGQEFLVPIEQEAQEVETAEDRAKLQSAKTKAEEIIKNAESQAVQLIETAKAQAQEQISAMAEQGRKDGFEAGKQQGLKAITQELSDKIIAVNDFAGGCFDVKNVIIKSAHLDIVNLVIQIAKKVCSNALKMDNSVLEEITLKAIHSLKDKESINIIVNPEMAEKIYAISEDLKEKIPQLESIKIIEDRSVSPDGTIVESPMSRVDDRVSSQINEIAEKLLNAVNSAKSEDLIPEIKEETKEKLSEEIQTATEEVEEFEELQHAEEIEEKSDNPEE